MTQRPRTAAEVDDIALRIAANELAAGRAALVDAYRIQDRTARRAAIREALGKIALAGRWIDDVVIRGGGDLH